MLKNLDISLSKEQIATAQQWFISQLQIRYFCVLICNCWHLLYISPWLHCCYYNVQINCCCFNFIVMLENDVQTERPEKGPAPSLTKHFWLTELSQNRWRQLRVTVLTEFSTPTASAQIMGQLSLTALSIWSRWWCLFNHWSSVLTHIAWPQQSWLSRYQLQQFSTDVTA